MPRSQSCNEEAGVSCRIQAPALVDRLQWRINRLRCMSAGEVAHRVLQAASIRAERYGLLDAGPVPPPDLHRRSVSWLHVPDGLDVTPYRQAADALQGGRYRLFALRGVYLGNPPRWNRDPKSGREAPLGFGKLLDYRNPALVGDIKYLWEINRHLHLVPLAQAWALTGEDRYFETISRHLESWIEMCPPGYGPNWCSSLEAALRLINWAATWQLLGGVDSPLFKSPSARWLRERWLESVHQHARFIEGYFSAHSSANNHLIGEAAGLFVAAVTWPHWSQSATWQARAKAILEREAQCQHADDGVNLEQTTAYQHFVFDLLLLPWLAGRANGIEFSDAYRATLERSLEFIASIMDAGGHVPMIGDADDGVVLSLDPTVDSQNKRFSAALACGALLFERPDFKVKAGSPGAHLRWLLGNDAQRHFEALPEPAADARRMPVRQAFRSGGYHVLGCGFERADEIRLVVDAGPLGLGGIAAHGHADALAFTLSVGGLEFLIDPGTCAYHTQGAWRAYFRGTGAHNTLRVDGLDQSEPGGNFMWLKKANALCSHWESNAGQDIFEGWHDGYRRLPDPVVHRRRITLDKTARQITVEDRLQMAGTHQVELLFHCSEKCRVVSAGPDSYRIMQDGRDILIALPRYEAATHQTIRGREQPICGWISHRFDEREPTTTLCWSARLQGDVHLVTTIDVV